jgi:hypothetical protein
MTNPYGPPPGQQPYPPQGQPMAPPAGYGPPSGPMPQQPMQPGMPQQPMQQPMPPQQPMPQQGGYPPPTGPGAPMGQPMAPPAPGMARVLIDCSYHWMAWMLMFFKPQVTINGQPGPILSWGKTPIDLPPGQHQIKVHTNYLWQVGNATAVVPVNAGQQVDVYYKAPIIIFTDGAIGPVPQKPPAMGLAIGIMAGSAALCFLIILLSIIASL